ncbi:MAG: cell division protein ZipA C-terminal FtsZ-binding domain-containing protein [Pontibacterium sp.]
MEIDWRTVLAFVGAGFVLLIIADGWRRMRRHNRNLKMDIDPSAADLPDVESTLPNPELPNGGARVKDQDPLMAQPNVSDPLDAYDDTQKSNAQAGDVTEVRDPLEDHLSSLDYAESSWQKDYLKMEGDESFEKLTPIVGVDSTDSQPLTNNSSSSEHVLGSEHPIDDTTQDEMAGESETEQQAQTLATSVKPSAEAASSANGTRQGVSIQSKDLSEGQTTENTSALDQTEEPLHIEPELGDLGDLLAKDSQSTNSLVDNQEVSDDAPVLTPAFTANTSQEEELVTVSTSTQDEAASVDTFSPSSSEPQSGIDGTKPDDDVLSAPRVVKAEPENVQETTEQESIKPKVAQSAVDTSQTEPLVRVVDDVIDLNKPLPLEFPNLMEPIEDDEWSQPVDKKADVSPYADILNDKAPSAVSETQPAVELSNPPETLKAQTETPEPVNSLVRVSDRQALSKTPDPEHVLSLIVWAENRPIDGAGLERILSACGMCYGDMSIFHRFEDGEDQGATQFSIANAFKPGTFDLDELQNTNTRGLNFFMSMEEPRDVMNAFECMLGTAETIAKHMGAEVLDENRSVLSQQTRSHYRQRIREFEMQQRIQGAR